MNLPLRCKWREVAAFRLTRHHLADSRPAQLTTLCHDVCGIQAQVMSAAHLALWARRHSLTPAAISVALYEDRTLVKASCMRQTLHLLTAADFPIYLAAVRRSRIAAVRRIMSRFGITDNDADALNAAILDALRPGPLTQTALRQHLQPLVGKNVRAWMQRVSSVHRLASVAGIICYGPQRGSEITVVCTDQWLPRQKPIPEEQAKQTLLRRYLAAYGPATLRDFSHWSGIPVSEARPVGTALADDLAEVDIEGQSAWILRADRKHLREPRSAQPVLRLLPSFDPYLLAHAVKDHLVHPRHYKRIFRQSAWISPVVLLDGQVIGVWSHQRKGARLLLEIEPFAPFTKDTRRQIEREAASLGAFLQATPELTFRKEG